MRTVLVAALVAGCAPVAQQAATPAWVNDTTSPGGASSPAPVVAGYREVAAKLISTARADHAAYDKLAYLTDQIGNRLAGSQQLDKAIAWAAQSMKDAGLDVRTEKVMVPHWVRGAEEATVTAPVDRRLHLLALGGSVATPKGGITAPIVVVHDWKELDVKADQIKGAIVVYNVAMPAWTPEHGAGYGKTVEYRWGGASQAAKRGAVASLVRSVTAKSLSTPHTGSMGYDKDSPKIPSAAISVEDAELLDRLSKDNKVTVHLRLEPQQMPDVESANVIGELRGREKPDEVVVIGGHIDSWDVGQGAHDDGAGVVTMMQALMVIKQLGLTPRRTIRVVLFTNEENGVRGAKAYAEEHKAELANTVLAVEADSGGFAPRGFDVGHKDAGAAKRVRARLTEVAALLAPLGKLVVGEGHGGTDIEPMQSAGVPQVGLDVDGRSYFDYHHTEADTLDKVDPQDLADIVAAVAVLAYVVADLPDRVDAL
ncbi:MAG TPA: M20/M25/M40 family metallo-hydrolase [Kofleriaceae bacterium]